MFLMLFTFMLTTALYLGVAGWVAWRVMSHLRTDEAALKAFNENVLKHVLVPIFGKGDEEKKS